MVCLSMLTLGRSRSVRPSLVTKTNQQSAQSTHHCGVDARTAHTRNHRPSLMEKNIPSSMESSTASHELGRILLCSSYRSQGLVNPKRGCTALFHHHHACSWVLGVDEYFWKHRHVVWPDHVGFHSPAQCWLVAHLLGQCTIPCKSPHRCGE